MIEAQGLEKTYRLGGREVRALRGVDLRLDRGEFAFVLGPSGSGKSTLLHLLGALDRPSSGKLLLDGRETARMTDAELTDFRRRHVGFIFQSFNLLPNLTALDNVLVPSLPRGISAEARRRAAELLERVGLAERLDHRPNELSGGEQQRVAVARALFKQPMLVLADEPTGELDHDTGREVFGYLRALNAERQTTFVVVTHDTTYQRPEDTVYRIRDGRIVERTSSTPAGAGTGAGREAAAGAEATLVPASASVRLVP
ncbi:MAG: ABC transporter ATP-binding protein [Planctomycetes bacterium]|nr:ABC transporter ATP-binding protein [Planctomycetota bacterium]